MPKTKTLLNNDTTTQSELDELKKQNFILRKIINKIDTGVMVVNAEGVTTLYNPAAGRLDGMKPKEVIGRAVDEVYPSLGFTNSTLTQVLSSKKPILNKYQVYNTMLGNRVNIVCSTYPITYKGEIVGSCDISKDITDIKKLSDQNAELREELLKTDTALHKKSKGTKYDFNDIKTIDTAFLNILRLARKVSESSSTILIYGETGTGKELLAQAIHNNRQHPGPFVAQNCAAFPSTLLESMLFGTVKGGYTGAENRSGLLELANGGTLFLDEINSMPMDLQSKLLRFLQEGTFRRVGETTTRSVNLRVIACSNMDPMEAVLTGKLRNDLYYRLNVVYFRIPSLRERPRDISILIDHFINHYNKIMNRNVARVNDAVLSLLQQHYWPGNVRELQHALEHAINICTGDSIKEDDLPATIIAKSKPQSGRERKGMWHHDDLSYPLPEYLKLVEKDTILGSLHESNGNVTQAAKKLGISRQTLHYRMQILNLVAEKSFREK